MRRPAHPGSLSGRKHHGCTCIDCYDAANEYERTRRRMIREGTWRPYVDAGPARRHLRKLLRVGMTLEMISVQTFMVSRHLGRIAAPPSARFSSKKIRPATEEIIVTTGFSMAAPSPISLVPAVGAHRRLRGLNAAGWPMDWIDRLIGDPSFSADAVFRHGRIQYRRYLAVVELCDRLSGADPIAFGVPRQHHAAAVARSIQAGWVPLSAWVQDIDDPRSAPHVKADNRENARPAGARRSAIVQDTAEMAEWGCGPGEISKRLGVEWASILVAHTRAGVAVPERLVA